MVANWTFNNTLAPTTGAHNTASHAALSAAVPKGEYNGGGVYYGLNGWPTGIAVDPAMYLEFSVTPNPGQQLHLEAIELVIRRSNLGTPSGGGPRAWVLRSSLDDYNSDVSGGALPVSPGTFTIHFGTEFLYLSSTVTFRLYGYDAHVNPGGSNRFVFDNIRITGLSILPIQFTGISGSITPSGPAITWTIEGDNIIDFTLERSADGRQFSTVTRVKKEGAISYTTTDLTADKHITRLFYRVKATLQRGEIIYSDIIVLHQSPQETLDIRRISANGSSLRLTLYTPEAGTGKIAITTFDGRTILQHQARLTRGMQEITVETGSGMPLIAVVTVSSGNGMISKQFHR